MKLILRRWVHPEIIDRVVTRMILGGMEPDRLHAQIYLAGGDTDAIAEHYKVSQCDVLDIKRAVGALNISRLNTQVSRRRKE